MKKRYMNEYIFEFLFFFFLAERAIFFPWRVSNRIEKLWCIHLCFIALIFLRTKKRRRIIRVWWINRNDRSRKETIWRKKKRSKRNSRRGKRRRVKGWIEYFFERNFAYKLTRQVDSLHLLYYDVIFTTRNKNEIYEELNTNLKIPSNI